MNTGKATIFEAMTNITSGKYVIPSFQRGFVWSLPQIEKLWDSILSGYPISTFLFWHIDTTNVSDSTEFRLFPLKYYFDSSKQSKFDEKRASEYDYKKSTVYFDTTDIAVLDGQQRLTALYLSLVGEIWILPKHARKSGEATKCKLVIELDQSKREDYDKEERSYNVKQFDIKITNKQTSATQFEIREIFKPEYQNDETREAAIENRVSGVSTDSKEDAKKILRDLYSKIFKEQLISYIDLSDTKQDDALEVFVRFNSAGKQLKRWEITTAILEAYWPNCKNYIDEALTGSYADFGTDFIIRTGLMLFSDVLKSNMDRKAALDLRNNWEQLKTALKDTETILDELNIGVSRFSSSWNIILPIIYSVYNNHSVISDDEAKKGILIYVVRAVLFTYFNSGTTAKLSKLKDMLNDNNRRFDKSWLDSISEFAVNDFKIGDILDSEKNGKIAGEALFYLSRSWLSQKANYELDHLHPRSLFDVMNWPGIDNAKWLEWRAMRDKLPNLWLLEGTRNASKNSDTLISFYTSKTPEQQVEFRKQAIIPNDVSFDIRDFEQFYTKRKKLLSDKIKLLLDGKI